LQNPPGEQEVELDPQLDMKGMAAEASAKKASSAVQDLRELAARTSTQLLERHRSMKGALNHRFHKPLGWVLLCVALTAFTLTVLKTTPHLSLTLSIGLSCTFFGILFILEDKLMFGFRESLAIFGWGFLVGSFIRNILFL
jgi:hypothetical protein